jgi:type IV secretory pathway TraG/TraD family ATPase VirD4
MKTTSYAVPAVLEAPGAVIATSNKRDLVDLTRGPRAGSGPVWVFDPQYVAGEEPTWWWNPLSYVTDETTARNLAVHFFTGSREPGARPDAYFDSAGRNLLTSYLLAAALDGRPITQVYRWLTRQADDTPAAILAAHGYDLPAEAVHARLREPDRQRAGTFGTALETVSCLTDRTVSRWITPGPDEDRPEFHPEEFIRGTGTLYSLSREGAGTAGPLVTALTVAVVEAAEQYAVSQPGGRLARPLLGVLDEAANVCRWKHLPDQYSHYGSRGIILMTILQSWSQGVEVWGLEAAESLRSNTSMSSPGSSAATPIPEPRAAPAGPGAPPPGRRPPMRSSPSRTWRPCPASGRSCSRRAHRRP